MPAIAFGILGVVPLGIQKSLHGTRLFKGALFGSALGGMYLVGMMEAYVAYPVSLFGEIYTGMADGVGILLLSLLLGRYMAEDATNGKKAAHTALPAVVVIAVAFIVIRYFVYRVLHIESSHATRPLATGQDGHPVRCDVCPDRQGERAAGALKQAVFSST